MLRRQTNQANTSSYLTLRSLSAMAASTGGPGTLTRSSVAAASVMLCAMVNAVTVSATRRQSRTRIYWKWPGVGPAGVCGPSIS